MSQLWAASLLAVGAAAVFACSAGLQRAAGLEHAELAGRGIRGLPVLVGRVVRRPRWWLGCAATVAGFALQAAALRFASVGLVQPLVALQVVVVLLLVALRRRRRPPWSGVTGALLVCLGAGAVLALVGRTVPAGTTPSSGHLPLVLAIVGTAVAAAVSASRGVPPGARALLLGAATGVCCGVTAVLSDAVVDGLATPAAGLRALAVLALDDWRLYALLGSVVASTMVGQAALAAGRLPATLAVVTAVNPAASIVVSACAAGVLPVPPPVLAAAGVAMLAMFAGAMLVTRAAAGDQEGVSRKTGMSRSVFSSYSR